MSQEFFDVAAQRRSVRQFRADPVPDVDLKRMLDAARLAPSGCNRQRWQFVVLRDPEAIAWFGDYPDMAWLQKAPALVLFCLDPSTEYWREDGSAAIQNFMLAATALGYGTCWVQGQIVPYEEQLRQRFGVPEEWRVLAAVPVGQPTAEPKMPKKKSLSDVLSFEQFEN